LLLNFANCGKTCGVKKAVLIIVIILISALVFLGFFARKTGKEEPTMGENVSFTTTDGIKIAATFYKAQSPNGVAVILLHMRAKNRSDWKDFASKLNDAGFDALAIDFRGHSESGGVRIDNFSGPDYQNLILDVKAAEEYLKTKDPNAKIAIVGASIGANTALNYAVQNPSVAAVVLLSPGLNYMGVRTDETSKQISAPVFLATSSDDPQSYQGLETWQANIKNLEVVTFTNAGHGTAMFSPHPELASRIIDWLKEKAL
jgi:alpha-beta hydrolase superfamily lysophospholipase